ncbi:MAG: type I DNA topoisomerase [Candidatus Portnoybacteria bacterium]
MNLVIVESPTKSKTIKKYLGKNYQVTASMGHIRDLPVKELGIDVKKNFEPEYVIPEKAEKTLKELKRLAKKSDLIILATDEDREGEAIAWHLLHILKPPKYQRIAFHEITKRAIEKALENPREINIDLVNAQQARRILDRLVGYKLSPFLWKKVVRGLSAGRVQSVAVRLIVDREKEVKAFKPEEYWSIEAKLKKEKEKDNFIAQLIKKDEKLIPKLGIKNKEEADKILEDLKSAQYKISGITRKETKRQPSPPFTTSTLQQEAVRKLGFSAQMTMRIAQQLYEGVKLGKHGSTGLITYHRTDSLSIASQAINGAQKFILEKFGKEYSSSRVFKAKSKGAQEAHEAIRPTKPSRQPEKIKQYLDRGQYRVYDLIWKRFIASQMSPAVFDSTSVDINAKGQSKDYLFRANGSTIKFDGFLKVYLVKITENILPNLSKNEILELIRLLSEQHFTKPPARFTEASLIKILEEHGIGRPSTYAPIIITIQKRGYVEKDEQKRFFPTEIGVIVTDLLIENFSEIVDVEFTARIEEDLDKIAQGKKNWQETLQEFYEPFIANVKEKTKTVEKKKFEEKTDKKCPKCKAPMVIKLGRFGKFYSCSKFPECKHAEPIINSTDVKCPECGKGEIIERKTRKGKTFYSCSQYPKCKFALWDKPINEKCPKCKSLLVEKGKQIKCSSKECNFKK